MKLPNLPKTIVIPICNGEYEVKLPNTGEEIDIAVLLQQVSSGRYESFKLSPLDLFQREADKIEAIAFFNILIPDLKKNLNLKSFFDCGRLQFDEIISAYREHFLPWYEKWQAFFANPTAEEQKEEPKA